MPSRLPTAAILTCATLIASGCKREPEPEVERVEVRKPDPAPKPQPRADARYARSLVELLDLVPPDADGYLVIRDLRPLMVQARRVEQVMAGPLSRAIPALAKLGGGTGQARLEQVEQLHTLLELGLAGLDASGVKLDGGVVVAFGDSPTILFATDDLQRLGTLAAMVGGQFDPMRDCGEVEGRAGTFACNLSGQAAPPRYRPAGQGQALVARLADRLGVDKQQAETELEPINLALSLAGADQSIDLALRTDDELWQLSMPLPSVPGSERMIQTGTAPAMAALVPGTSFAWARIDPVLLAESTPVPGPVNPAIYEGEVFFGVIDQPDGIIARLSLSDFAAAKQVISTLAERLPAEAIEPEGLEGFRLVLDRASIQLGEERVPSIGLVVSGAEAEPWAASLGIEPRARLWASPKLLGLAIGQSQAIPAALERQTSTQPSKAALASLPPTLNAALGEQRVGLLVHLVLDHWQAPIAEAELQSLLTGMPAENRPSATGIDSSFQTLAPWSSVDLWLERASATSPWIVHLALVPFGASADANERQAAAAVLDAVLAGSDGSAGYAELAKQYAASPHAASYRARAGQAPEHHATATMALFGSMIWIGTELWTDSTTKARSSEAPAQTQSILSAALQLQEHEGCKAILGEVGPTPPLELVCEDGDGGRCEAGDADASGPGRYDAALWDDPVWTRLGLRLDRHRFHYQYTAKASSGGCEVSVKAIGDADDDGTRPTYERSASIAADGTQSLAPMRIDGR